jgi:hypothetical protein
VFRARPHLELVERLIRTGYYMEPVNGYFSIASGVCGANPFDLMELIRRAPHGSFFTRLRFDLPHPVAAICIALGQHTRRRLRGKPLEPRRAQCVEMSSYLHQVRSHFRTYLGFPSRFRWRSSEYGRVSNSSVQKLSGRSPRFWNDLR